MSKKFRLLMALVLVVGLFGGLLTGSTVSADPSPGQRFQIPRIDLGDVFGTTPAGEWDTKIQIQNVGSVPAVVKATFYPEFEGDGEFSAIDDATRTLPVHGVWTLHNLFGTLSGLSGTESAIIETTTTDAKLAVTVDRWGTDAFGLYEISSSYTAIADDTDMVGPADPYSYYAPYVMSAYHNLDTTITIQNSGELATSVWIYYKQEGNCECMKAQHIEVLAKGEAIRVGPGPDADLNFPPPDACSPGNGDWLGSAWITANEPLGIIVDQLSLSGLDVDQEAVMLTYRGMPSKPVTEPTWGKEWYADLLYREISGWLSSIQVQNLTEISQPTFVTVEFFDQSGDSIFFVGDWICRNGAKTFYLPALVDLGVNYPFGYVGAAEIESHEQVDYPGGDHDGAPIFVVVDLKKDKLWDGSGWRHTLAGESQGGAYNAHPGFEKENANVWAMPYIAKEQDGVTSRIAIRNNGNCNKIQGRITIYDETGTAIAYVPVPWLQPKHMKIFDLNYLGVVYPGFVGSAVFAVGAEVGGVWQLGAGIEQLCDTNHDGHVDNAAYMPSVVVMNYGWEREVPPDPYTDPMEPIIEGDLTRIYEAIPFDTLDGTCVGDVLGKVHSIDPGEDNAFDAAEPIEGVNVTGGGADAVTTNSTGDYELLGATAGPFGVLFQKTGDFEDYTEAVTLDCGEDLVLDAEMYCLGTVDFKVWRYASGEDVSLVSGAAVTYDASGHVRTGTLNALGQMLNLETVLIDDPTTIISVTGAYLESAGWSWDQFDGTPAGINPVAAAVLGTSNIDKGTNGCLWTGAAIADTGQWYGYHDGSCPNINAFAHDLDNQMSAIPATTVDLLMCATGTVAGLVTAGGEPVVGETVTVIQNGVEVKTGVTSATGSYVINQLATECFKTGCVTQSCAQYYVRVAGWQQGPFTWNGCGDHATRNFVF